jgi:uncharacterized protein (TIGR00106 family)
MVLLEFSMSPLGKGESVSKYVSRSLDIIDKSGVAYRLNPMGTVLEGEWDEVFAVVRKCYERMKKDCNRISCSIKVDYRKGHSGRGKDVEAVNQAIGGPDYRWRGSGRHHLHLSRLQTESQACTIVRRKIFVRVQPQ